MAEESRDVHFHSHSHSQSLQDQPPPQYGTFQGVPNYSRPAIGLPHPVPPPGFPGAPPPLPTPQYYVQGYHAVPGYAVVEGRPVREHRLPCCGIGFGWFLFIVGFFLAAIPWYVAALVLICSRVEPREKPGYIACAIAAIVVVVTSPIIFGLTRIN